MMEVETVVIGAGVVGLACARALALAGREVIVLERAAHVGTETSSRNSEVIHSGIYYPPGSLKARLCVAGRDMLYAYCRERAIPHRRLGKLIVATSDAETSTLSRYHELAGRNHVALDLEILEHAAHQDDQRRMQPKHLLQDVFQLRAAPQRLVGNLAVVAV